MSPRTRGRPAAIQRIGPGDAMELATDVGPVPMNITAVLVLDPAQRPGHGEPTLGGEAERLRVLVADRAGRIPRFHQRLVELPAVLGRPIWVDDDDFDPRNHVTTCSCSPPGDRQALLDVAAREAIQPLSRSRPLWRAVVVDGLAGDRLAVVVVVHHVLTDGIGGLAALATLADSAPDVPAADPAPMPTRGELLRDKLEGLGRSVRTAPATIRAVGGARAELGDQRRRGLRTIGRADAHSPQRPADPGGEGDGDRKAPRCSLNVPVSGGLKVSTVDEELGALLHAAHAHGASLNDLLLVAVTAALESVLASRGERVPALVVSVPISGRRAATGPELGNRVGVMPVRVALTGPTRDRLRAVTATTSLRKGAARGSSLQLLGPVFRGLAALGAFAWFVNRQRLINTLLSNVRGPGATVRLGDRPVSAVIPVTALAGNVTAAFTALSYGGRLVISVMTDPVHVPESEALQAALARQLQALMQAGDSPGPD